MKASALKTAVLLCLTVRVIAFETDRSKLIGREKNIFSEPTKKAGVRFNRSFTSITFDPGRSTSPHQVADAIVLDSVSEEQENFSVTTTSLTETTYIKDDVTHVNYFTDDVEMTFDHSEYSSVYLSSDEVKDCLNRNLVRMFNITFMVTRLDINSSEVIPGKMCSLKVNVVSSLVVKTHIVARENVACQGLTLQIFDTGRHRDSLLPSCMSTADEIFSYTNSIEVFLARWTSSEKPFFLYLNISGVPFSARPQLEIKYTSANQGYVQTPGFDEKKLYPMHMDSWVQIPVPEHHKVMTNFYSVNITGVTRVCAQDSLSLYTENLGNTTQILRICSFDSPPPALHNATNLYVHFLSSKHSSNTGFQLVFSFHDLSSLPQQLSDGRWNCSVPHWPDFRLHFPCNLVSDCVGGEDEVDCPYTTDLCGRGFQWMNSTCLQFLKADKKVSWNDALDTCVSHGMLLLSVHTPADWEGALNLLSFRPHDEVYYGLRAGTPSLPPMYRGGLTWVDETFAHYLPHDIYFSLGVCFMFFSTSELHQVRYQSCSAASSSLFICEAPGSGDEALVQMPVSIKAKWSVSVLRCPSHYYTHTFLACDVNSQCWAPKFDPSRCEAPLTPLPPLFTCDNEYQRVPYTLVCDHRPDCSDSSDESFCIFPACPSKNFYRCANSQCILSQFQCDKRRHCVDNSDESGCHVPDYYAAKKSERFPAIVNMSHEGKLQTFKSPSTSVTSLCPETHFQCPGVDFYCLPVYVRCNGVFDCPGKQDETACDTYICPGYYRCRSSHVCLHPHHVCDGWSQCPEGDDELLCHLTCPHTCVCHGLAFTCTGEFLTNNYLDLRFLDAHGSGMTPRDVVNNTMLVHLSFVSCNITFLDDLNFVNLNSLDLSDNYIISFRSSAFRKLHNLKYLSLAGNRLASLYSNYSLLQPVLQQIIYLDISRVSLVLLDNNIAKIFPSLQRLNLSDCGVEEIAEGGLESLKKLRSIDLRGSLVVYFPPQTFTSLNKLESVYTDNYKVCCPASLPQQFNQQKCVAPSNEISSCDALLRSTVYRVFLSLFAALALMGNAGSFVYRVFISRKTSNLGFDVFVTNLSIADFVMGVYLAIIGIADRVYLGNYLWNDLIWRNSFVCKLAGFLCLLSSEVSTFIILLVTLDRFLIIKFPLSVFHFFKRSAWIASGLVWSVGLIIALIPLLPSTADWNFYSKYSICIPLPITRESVPENDYAFSIIIILNGILFLIIASGQAFIFWSVKLNSMPNSDISKKTKDLTIARRLITVAVSDFCCKFPVALLGLLAARGTPVSSEVIVALVIFIVPLNSALNPFLYTFNVMMERRRKAREVRLKKYFKSLTSDKKTPRQ